MTDETKAWAWEAGVLYENGVPLATATRECGILHAQMIVAAPDMARALFSMLRHGTRPRSNVDEMHTVVCWEGIRANTKREGHGHPDCEQLHAALAKAGVTL